MTAEQQANRPVCLRLGCNLYRRLDHIKRMAEAGYDKAVRKELLSLLKFFPKSATNNHKPA